MSHYKPYPSYKESGVEWIGRVPEHWEVKRLRHAATFKNSNVDKKSYEGQRPIHLCNYTDVYYNEFITSGLSFMPSTASAVEVEQFSLKRGDVIITKDSEDPSDIGIPAIVVEALDGVVCGYHLTVIRSNDFEASRVIHRALQSSPTRAHFFVEAPGITRYGLNQDAIGDTRICLPPQQERKNLADHIDRETSRIDALIAKKTRFIELLQEKRQALITHAVTKGLDPNVKMKDSGVEWIGEVPEHWEVSKLAYTTREVSGKTPDTKNEAYWGGEVPWVSPKDMKQAQIAGAIDRITDLAVQECGMTVFRPGTILAVVRGMILAHSFPVATLEVPATINQDMKALETDPRIRANYLRLILEAAKDYVVSVLVAEAAHGTRVLRTDVWRQLPALLPPLYEQDAILSELNRITTTYDKIIQRVDQSITLFKERRSAFITAAVTGQIDLREAA